jgi:hypothetical protein
VLPGNEVDQFGLESSTCQALLLSPETADRLPTVVITMQRTRTRITKDGVLMKHPRGCVKISAAVGRKEFSDQLFVRVSHVNSCS